MKNMIAVKRMNEWIDFLKRRSDYGSVMNIDSGVSSATCYELAIELEQFIKIYLEEETK
jgi:hypothetical protein